MTEQRLDTLYKAVNSSIQLVKADIRHAENQQVFDPENSKLNTYITERKTKLAELKRERLAILRAN